MIACCPEHTCELEELKANGFKKCPNPKCTSDYPAVLRKIIESNEYIFTRPEEPDPPVEWEEEEGNFIQWALLRSAMHVILEDMIADFRLDFEWPPVIDLTLDPDI